MMKFLIFLISFNCLANEPVDDCGMTINDRLEPVAACMDLSGSHPVESFLKHNGDIEHLEWKNTTIEEFLMDYELVE